MSEEKRKELLNSPHEDGVTVIESNINDLVSPQRFLDDKQGRRYIDINTKEIYLCRNLPVIIQQLKTPITCRFYISERTGLIVREADSQKKWEEYYKEMGWDIKIPSKEEKENFIEEFNRLQKQGGWMRLKTQEYKKQNKLDEAQRVKFNQYIYEKRPNEYIFCNAFNSRDKFWKMV